MTNHPKGQHRTWSTTTMKYQCSSEHLIAYTRLSKKFVRKWFWRL